MSYAIIKVGGKQYRVSEGETLLVDRVKTDEGKTFTPDLLFVPDGDGNGVTVTAKVVGHEKGPKIRIGKYKKRTGYKRHTGYRSSLTRIQIESIGKGSSRAAAKPKAETPKAEAPKAVEAPKTDAPVRQSHPPQGYEEMTVAQIAEGVSSWRRPNIEAALEYEREHANRKGAIAALESALAAKEEQS